MFQDGSDRWSTFTPRGHSQRRTPLAPARRTSGKPPPNPLEPNDEHRAKAERPTSKLGSHQPSKVTGHLERATRQSREGVSNRLSVYLRQMQIWKLEVIRLMIALKPPAYITAASVLNAASLVNFIRFIPGDFTSS